jgi:spore coat polysaccharide biosynthesis protein SpsF
MAASRLPGKVMKELGPQPVLAWVMERAQRARMIDEVIVATTTDIEDDVVANFCQERTYAYTRGSMHDVLDRYYQAAQLFGADVIVRLTADCPLIDPEMLDSNIQTFLDADPPLDFAANRLPMERTVPIGLDTEICTFPALETAWREATKPYHREHVMPFFYEHPERFRNLHIKHEPDYGHLRWTVDVPEDLELLRQIVAHFDGRDDFGWEEVLALVEARPELSEINAGVQHKGYLDVDERL